MISCLLSIKVKPDKVATATETLSSIERQALTHEGVLTFMWFQHQDQPTCFSLLEQWRSQADLDAHVAKIIDVWNGFAPSLDGQPTSTRLSRLNDGGATEHVAEGGVTS